MRRSRTPTTAWPAVADLMTLFAVVGLFAAAAVAVGREEPPEDDEPERVIDSLTAVIDSQSTVIHSLKKTIAGFTPCWPGDPEEKLYFFAYDITHNEGRYTVSRHAEFERGIGAETRPPDLVAQVLRDVPRGSMGGDEIEVFGRRVSEAIRGHYASDCKLAVEINSDASGDDMEPLRRGGFYPIWKRGAP